MGKKILVFLIIFILLFSNMVFASLEGYLVSEPIADSYGDYLPWQTQTIGAGIWVAGGYNFVINNNGTAYFRGIRMENVISADVGFSNIMVITSDGVLWSYGSNRYGQIGNGTSGFSVREPVSIKQNVVAVSVGRRHALAITHDGIMWTWGKNLEAFDRNTRGEFIYNTINNILNPIPIMDDVIYVSAGEKFSMFITSDNNLWALGINNRGQLGDGTTRDRTSPVMVMENVISVSAGTYHTLAITKDGNLWAWGHNGSGRLGDGTTTTRLSPVLIMENVISASAGGSHSMAITADNNLWAWGSNSNGRLGDGTTTSRRLRPRHIMEEVVSVSAGGALTFALTTDGNLWAWGQNRNDFFGDDGRYSFYNTPINIRDNVRLPGYMPVFFTAHYENEYEIFEYIEVEYTTAYLDLRGLIDAHFDDRAAVTQTQTVQLTALFDEFAIFSFNVIIITLIVVGGFSIILSISFSWWKSIKKQKNLETEQTIRILEQPMELLVDDAARLAKEYEKKGRKRK